MTTYDFDGAVPAAGAEELLLDVAPVDREDLARVLVPLADREVLRSHPSISIPTTTATRPQEAAGALTLSTVSHSLTLPSPDAVASWFSCTSLHARSYSPSCVSNLRQPSSSAAAQPHFPALPPPDITHTFSTPTPCGPVPNRLSLPFPTSPTVFPRCAGQRGAAQRAARATNAQFADPATASLFGKKGEKATPYAANLCGRLRQLRY